MVSYELIVDYFNLTRNVWKFFWFFHFDGFCDFTSKAREKYKRGKKFNKFISTQSHKNREFSKTCFCAWLCSLKLSILSFHLLILQILDDAAKLSQRMEHRGACSADNDTGDGAGALVAIPHDFYANQMR